MQIGFTGTQYGMTEAQKVRLAGVFYVDLMAQFEDEVEFSHGDCVGSDEWAHYFVATNFDPFTTRILIYPGLTENKRAYCKGGEVQPLMDNLARNAIIATREVLIATPRTFHEILRSGTWHTVRTFAKLEQSGRFGKRKLFIIRPDGTIQREFKSELVRETIFSAQEALDWL